MSDSTLIFPAGLDDFEPTLINNQTPVNADHILDLRIAILELEKAILGPTTLNYSNNSVVEDNDSIKTALQKLDQFSMLLAEQLGIVTEDYIDGYSSRLQTLEDNLAAHSQSNGGIDSAGNPVHGVEGAVVGTLNKQTLYAKILDTTNDVVGTKIKIRAHPSETTRRQIEIYDYQGTLKSWIDGNGNARFKDLTLDGYVIQAGADIIKNSLIVDGYSILGSPTSPTDYLQVNGNSSFNGSLTLNGDLVLSGTNASLTTSSILTINTPDAYINGGLSISSGLTATGRINLGGDQDITIRSSVAQTQGYFYVGEFRADGTKFLVENDEVKVNASKLIVNSSTATFGQIAIDGYQGNITADGYAYSFGNLGTIETNTISLNGITSVGADLIVANNLQVDSGTISSNGLESNLIATNQLDIGSSLTAGALALIGTAIFSDDSSSSALKITQTGSGNALFIEDDTSPDSTPLVVDSSGNLIIGKSASVSAIDYVGNPITPKIQQLGSTYATTSHLNALYTTGIGSASYTFAKSRAATIGDHTAVNGEENLGTINFAGSDGLQFRAATSISSEVDGPLTTDNVPGRIVFSTTPRVSSSLPLERMRITKDGYVGIGTTSPSSTLHVSGSTTFSGLASLQGSLKYKTRIVTENNYIASGSDLMLVVDPTGPATVVLPPNELGRVVTVKRRSVSYPVTIIPATGTIDGSSTMSLSANFQKVTLVGDGETTWLTVADSVTPEIPSLATSIDQDVDFDGYNGINMRSARFENQASLLSDPTDLNCIFFKDGNFYINNASGTSVQITNGNNLSFASVGAIGGDYGQTGVTASAVYSDTSKTFTFTQATNQTAKMNVGDLLIAKTDAGALPVTLRIAGTVATSYDYFIPSAAPTANQLWRQNSSNDDASFVTIQGTSNQITITHSASAITASLPSSLTAPGTLSVTGNFDVATSKFTVSSTTGNTAIAGSLNVSGDITTNTLYGNATTASKWQNARTITLSGDVAGSVSIDGSSNVSITTTIQPDSVALGTDTTGNYVQSIAGTVGQISVSGSGEAALITLSLPSPMTIPDSLTVSSNLTVYGDTTLGNSSLDQLSIAATTRMLSSLRTRDLTVTNSSDVGTFSVVSSSGDTSISGTLSVTGSITGSLNGNASTASKWQNARTITLSGDVAGSASIDGSSNVSITTTIQPNSVTLGTDTDGYYVQSIAGTANQISVAGSGSESAAVTLSLPSSMTTPGSLSVTSTFTASKQFVQTWYDSGDVAATFNIDWNNGSVQRFALYLNNITTFTVSNPLPGAQYTIIMRQGSTARTVTWPASFKWANNTPPTITTISSYYIIKLFYDSVTTNYLCYLEGGAIPG